MLHHTTKWLWLVQILCLLQSSSSFSVNRTDRDCTLQATSNLYNSYSSIIDASDLSRYRDLQLQTNSEDKFQTNFYNISSQYDIFRSRTKCPRPSLSWNDTAKAVQYYLVDCMCQGVRNWLIQPTIAAYRCDIHYSDTTDLNQLLKAKTQRFNRYVRIQLSIQGDRSLLSLYDSLVTTCVDSYLEGDDDLPATLQVATSKPTPKPTPRWWGSSDGSGSSYRHLRGYNAGHSMSGSGSISGSRDSRTAGFDGSSSDSDESFVDMSTGESSDGSGYGGSHSNSGGSILEDDSSSHSGGGDTLTSTSSSGSQSASTTTHSGTNSTSTGRKRVLLSVEAGVVK